MQKEKAWAWVTGIGACLLAVGVFVFLWGCSLGEREALGQGDVRRKSILVAGVDEAGDNTDMLMLCSQNLDNGKLTILQIPRDTLYRNAGGTGKINRIYRSNASKYGKKKAAELMMDEFSEALGVPIDAYLVFGGQTVKEFVDLVGGVTLDLPFPLVCTDAKTGKKYTLPEGERTLSGEEALTFVRHRASYVEGDLGRLDAQLRFLCAVCEGAPKLKQWDRLLGVYQKILPNLLTNLREKDIIELMMAYLKSGSSVSLSFLRLPGEAVYTEGAWYYVLHRAATEKMLADFFDARVAFDAQKHFTDPTVEAVGNIYSYPASDYRVLTAKDVKTGKILRKKS